jgi:hypothetical protein
MRNMANEEPVMTVGAIVAVVSAGLLWARLMGWITWTDDQFNGFLTFLALLLPLGGALWARAKVTPLSSPRAKDGTRLIRDEMVEE